MKNQPLKDLLVLDFSIIMAGPLCSRYLADAGARVIKVESAAGDTVRSRPPLIDGESAYFAAMNSGKESVVLDLKNEEGKHIAKNIAKKADIVLENFRPGVMDKFGLGYEDLYEQNPALIYASISGYGQFGPKAKMPAYAPVIHAASGYEYVFMEYQQEKDKPYNNGIFVADVMAAAYAFGAIQMALFERGKSGKGQRLDVSLIESVFGMLIYEQQAAQNPPDKRRQIYEPVRASDGWIMVAAVTRKNLSALFDLIGQPDAINDPRFATVAEKEEHWSQLLEMVEEWASKYTSRECEEMLMAAGVPCSRYRNVEEVLKDAQLKNRDYFGTVEVGGAHVDVGNYPVKFLRTPLSVDGVSPKLGEHTKKIVSEFG